MRVDDHARVGGPGRGGERALQLVRGGHVGEALVGVIVPKVRLREQRRGRLAFQ